MVVRSLSARAWHMLNREPRDYSGEPIERAEIEQILLREGCPANHAIVAFQLALGGYTYKLRGNQATVSLGMTNDPIISMEHNHWFCAFCCYDIAPGPWLLMDESGRIYADEATPIASCAEVFIESHAMEEWLLDQHPVWMRSILKVPDQGLAQLSTQVAQLQFAEIPAASDAFQTWWMGGDCALHKADRWEPYDPANPHSVIVYAPSAERLSVLCEELGTVLGVPCQTRPIVFPYRIVDGKLV